MKYDTEQMTFIGTAGTAEESAALALHYEIIAAAQTAAASLLDLARKIKRMRDTSGYKALGFDSLEAYTMATMGMKQRQAYNYIAIAEKLPAQLSHDSLQASVTKNSQDLTALKLSHESLEASVIKDGEVRSKFAMDTSSVTISGGIITFSGNTLVVESDNFKLTKSGSVSITGSITSKGNTGNAAVNEGLITLDALNANGKRYSTVYLGRTAKDYPSGALTVYSRRADGTVGRGVYIHGSDTDANIWMFDAYDKEKVHLSTGTYSNFNGGINVTGNYGVQVSYGVSCQTLSAWQSKSGIAKTSFGNLQIGAIEAPEPMYADAGSGICDVNGLCHIYADPRYAESVSQYKQSRWIITPVNSGGNLWVEKTDSLNVIVHGKKYQMFDWLCLTPKANGSTEYAEITDAEEPKNADETKNMLDMIVSESAEEEQNAYNALFDF